MSTPATPACLFCNLSQFAVQHNDVAYVLRDRSPVSPGHSLVIPRRHVNSIFELSDQERLGFLALAQEAQARLQTEFEPQGFNLGINEGTAAGQSVMHLHLHLIPRFAGDVAEPRGGVRWLVPTKADYWSPRPSADDTSTKPAPSFEEFAADARARGASDVLERRWEPGTELATHTHPFGVEVLVVQGEMWLGVCDSPLRRLVPSERFALARELPHAERYGEEGATYWVARWG